MPLEIKWRGGVAQLHGTIADQRVRRSAKTRDPEVAERIRAETEARLIKAALYGAENEATFADACVLYQKEGRRRRYLAPLIRSLGNKRLAAINPGTLTALAMKLYPEGKYKNSTRNTCVLKPARAVINFAHTHGLCHPIKVQGFYEAKVERPPGDREWLDEFRAACDTCFSVGKDPGMIGQRLKTLALMMWVTAARIGECIVLEPEHLDLESKRGVGPPSKNGDPRIYYLTDELVRELRLLKPRRINYGQGPERVFGWATRQGPDTLWRQVVEKAGLPKLTPHEAGRHGFATETVVRQGMDLKTAADIGNWKDPTVLLRRYAHSAGLGTRAEAAMGTNKTGFNGTSVTHEKPTDAQRLDKSA